MLSPVLHIAFREIYLNYDNIANRQLELNICNGGTTRRNDNCISFRQLLWFNWIIDLLCHTFRSQKWSFSTRWVTLSYLSVANWRLANTIALNIICSLRCFTIITTPLLDFLLVQSSKHWPSVRFDWVFLCLLFMGFCLRSGEQNIINYKRKKT